MFKKTLGALMIVLMMVSVASAREIDEVDLPETLMAGDKLLVLNGAGTRNVFFNDVYVAGLWLESAKTDGAAICNAEESMIIRMHVINDFFASSSNITSAFKKGFRYAMPRGDTSSIREEIARLNAAFADEIKDHEEFDIVYIPGKGTSIYKEGELKDTIPGYEFKKLLFGIWLSEKATVNDGLTEGMLEGKISKKARAAKEKWIASVKIDKGKVQAEAAAKAAAEAEAKMKAAAMAKAAEAESMAAAEAEAIKMADAKKAADARAKKVAAEKAAMAKAAEASAAKEVAVASTGVTKITKKEFRGDDIYFAKNSSSLSNKSKKALKLKASWLKANPDASTSIEVSCDSRGSREYNFALAQRRAKSVVTFMIKSGIDSTRMYMVILGEDEVPEGAPQNEATWAKSRKAHFTTK